MDAAQPAPATPALPAPPLSAEALKARWLSAWPKALEVWSSFTMLREPVFFKDDEDAKREGMAGEIAAIRLSDQTVMVNLKKVADIGLDGLGLEVLAHEIGHHVFVPGNMSDNARMISVIKPIYSGMPNSIPHLVANLYGDLLLNDRLQRRTNLNIAGVYRKLKERSLAFKDAKGNAEPTSALWKVYTRTYEYLWRLPMESLSPSDVSPEANADAILLARIIRHFAGRWIGGVRRFAYILYQYIADDEQNKRQQTFIRLGMGDTKCACSGGKDGDAIPDGLAGIEGWELSEDDGFEDDALGESGESGDSGGPGPDLIGRGKKKVAPAKNTVPTQEGKGSRGQFREPFQYGELLRSLGLNLKDHEITTRYYRERALPHLIPFPKREAPRVMEPLAEGTESWEAGNALDDLDLMSSLLRSPVLIPGVTTEQRVYGETPGHDPARVPMDLDIYVDCSGSMPCPSVHISYLALAAAILALSALRAGARVQATLWSGVGQFDTSAGFIRDENRILGIVTGYIAGGTAFPLNVLRETYRDRSVGDPPAHIVIISDNGIDTILSPDEFKTPGEKLCTDALAKARGGATMVLNLPAGTWKPGLTLKKLGFAIHRVTDWEQLVVFAREFVRRNYER